MTILPATQPESNGMNENGASTRRRFGDDTGSSEPLLRGRTNHATKRKGKEWRIIPTGERARKNFGMALLGVVVFAWVSSNFLTHAIFADDSYSKPCFITYLNTSMFCLYLIPSGVRELLRRRREKLGTDVAVAGIDSGSGEEGYGSGEEVIEEGGKEDKLNTRETMRLSAEFCLIWFFANYFNSYCLKFTSVSSATILSSTSSMFTLLLGTLLRIEIFTSTKFLSVIASLIGIYLISTTDLSPASPSDAVPPSNINDVSAMDDVIRSPLQILMGDSMALLSAFSYATYITLLKLRIGSESRINMQLFFGFVGLFNVLFLWPLLIILHFTGIEPFELPPESRVWAIILVNASITLTSDFCWAYAMLLTTPLVVTVGLSLTIPLSLMGQMVLYGTEMGPGYWLGAGAVFVAFWVLSREENAVEGEGEGGRAE
ncbi:Similar to Uncharacterized vacuolar membrane protein YML018C; acc. no. Q03730 [Pyronema omphalodes CBS 100304]|uniref:Similar to Uncharacterized vacuolar membrane protein YML018C acc. no. Q03730 n=1 Tax=Pyronema omphalodes (strain CBS 100304) TaxID=1076935 RepID=U4L1Q4_PYROM|nr:Similar to Uncharacterized vacuolar membrane protein YML018C; acc. no. Q03730 [Pyronema omphalodes CBS 100304]